VVREVLLDKQLNHDMIIIMKNQRHKQKMLVLLNNLLKNLKHVLLEVAVVVAIAVAAIVVAVEEDEHNAVILAP
jgi:hypothetical protein